MVQDSLRLEPRVVEVIVVTTALEWSAVTLMIEQFGQTGRKEKEMEREKKKKKKKGSISGYPFLFAVFIKR